MESLVGRSAVITGGASGIGLATARRLDQEGVRLLLADIEQGPLDAAAAELGALTFRGDVGSYEEVLALADFAFAELESVDIVFNNAGVAIGGDISTMSHADWEWVMRVNLWGPIHGVEAFLPRMIAQGTGGHLLFTASFAGLVPNVGLGPYTVTKYGVVALAEVLQRELRSHDIGVSVLCPMRVDTNIFSSERNRPTGLGGPDASPRVHDPRDTTSGHVGSVLPVEAIVDQIIDAIRADELYIVPHLESREPIRRRFARIDAAFDR